MKKLRSLVLLLLCGILLTGCVKSRTSMTIDNSKNVKYETELLISDTLGGSSGESIKKEDYEKRGFTVTDLKENGYSGYKFTKNLGNLDSLSNGTGEAVNISEILDNGSFDFTKLFKVEKGFLKNTYTANFVYTVDSSDIDMGGDDEETLAPTENEVETVDENALLPAENNVPTTNENEDETDTTGTTETTGTLLDEDADYSALLGDAEFTYTVNLPVKATSNNATEVLNDGKTLKWKMSMTATTEIKYAFEMYNMTNLIIVGGGALAVLIILIIIIVVAKKKKASKETLIHKDYDPSIEGKIDETTPAQATSYPAADVTVPTVGTEPTPAAPETAPAAAPEVAPAPAEPTPVPETPGMDMSNLPGPEPMTNLEFNVTAVPETPQFVDDNNVEIKAPTFDPNARPDFVRDTEVKTFVTPEAEPVAPATPATPVTPAAGFTPQPVNTPVQNVGGLDVPVGTALSDMNQNNPQ